MTHKTRLTILGATGTIGTNTLDVIAQHPERFEVFALTGQTQLEKLAQLCGWFSPRFVVVQDEQAAVRLTELLHEVCVSGGHFLKTHASSLKRDMFESSLISPKQAGSGGHFFWEMPEVLYGQASLEWVAAHPETDAVMAAIVGAAGLVPAMAAAKVGKRILLANKESLVMAGAFFMEAVREHGATLLPVDSEHNAIFQCLAEIASDEFLSKPMENWQVFGVDGLILTASGGPFRGKIREQLLNVTPEEACAHPNWVMGKKISVDSASLMNKGLEVIEAHHLFSMPPEHIEVLVHPQSVIHSMVRYCDGSVLAQLGTPDMKTPIAQALSWPERMTSGAAKLDFLGLSPLTFELPDMSTFRCLSLAFDALKLGGGATAVLNAANEVAVTAFLVRQISFLEIAQVNEQALERFGTQSIYSLDDLLALDEEVRTELSSTLGLGVC